ncbi:MAG: response regulator [Deltaproteobacteria bacterium]|nr:response regulator [Candidatus Anaeroferrophillacea bacterium]
MKVLLVDDDRAIVDMLYHVLLDEGYQPTTATNGIEALEHLSRRSFDLVLTDLKMPRMGGMELLGEIGKLRNPPLVIIITGYATVETAVCAIKMGVYDYIIKPFNIDHVKLTVRRAIEKQRLERENIQLKEMIVLYNASEAISSSLEATRIIEVMLDAACVQSLADLAVLYLRDEMSRDLVLSGHQGSSGTERECEEFVGSLPAVVAENHLRPFFNGHGVRISAPGSPLHELLCAESPHRGEVGSLLSISLKANNRFVGLLNLFSLTPGVTFSDHDGRALYILAAKGAGAIENAFLYENTQQNYLQTIRSFACALEAKDRYTHGHSQQVTRYAEAIARAMKLSVDEIELLGQAGMLHDIGKIGISEAILNKPGPLTASEYEIIKQHPVTGKHILMPITSLSLIVPIVYHHHERWDGSGYPDGLGGADIPLMSRILGVADAFDAMTSIRAYRRPLAPPEAFAEIFRGSGSQFDPAIVDIFLHLRTSVEALMLRG